MKRNGGLQNTFRHYQHGVRNAYLCSELWPFELANFDLGHPVKQLLTNAVHKLLISYGSYVEMLLAFHKIRFCRRLSKS